MVMMATGSGKSLCYQLPVVALRDLNPACRSVTICISPLISLMTDQVPWALIDQYTPSTLLLLRELTRGIVPD